MERLKAPVKQTVPQLKTDVPLPNSKDIVPVTEKPAASDATENNSMISSDAAIVSSTGHFANAASYSRYFDDLDEWLEATGYHDATYRKNSLRRWRKLRELDVQRALIEREALQDLGTSQYLAPIPTRAVEYKPALDMVQHEMACFTTRKPEFLSLSQDNGASSVMVIPPSAGMKRKYSPEHGFKSAAVGKYPDTAVQSNGPSVQNDYPNMDGQLSGPGDERHRHASKRVRSPSPSFNTRRTSLADDASFQRPQQDEIISSDRFGELPVNRTCQGRESPSKYNTHDSNRSFSPSSHRGANLRADVPDEHRYSPSYASERARRGRWRGYRGSSPHRGGKTGR